ncbi:unnamed protein product, partial [Didymodactylos carnosus]
MTSSINRHRIDSEIEKYRIELNWTKIQDKIKQIKINEYTKFLDGEAQLELYLQQHSLIDDKNIQQAREQLRTVERTLNEANSDKKNPFDVQCLLSKLFYSQARYDDCNSSIAKALINVPKDTKDNPNRSSLLLAELFSLKGLLVEKTAPTLDKSTLNEIIQYFENSVKLSQKYYTDVEKSHHYSSENLDIENPLIELAFQRVPLLQAKNGNLSTAIEIFRSYIQNVHIKSLETMRQTLIKQFAQLLIKCVCKANYSPIKQEQMGDHKHSMYIPRDSNEETILLLLLAETSALNEAVLDWQPQYEEQRERSHHQAYTILALLAIFLARKQAYNLIAD